MSARILDPATIGQWADIPNWQGKEVLLLEPHDPDVVSQFANVGAGVKCIESQWQAFAATHRLHGHNHPIVYMQPLGYLRGVQCQRYDYVINCGENTIAGELSSQMIRATKFNGKAIDVIERIVHEKEPGFLISGYPRCGTHMVVTSLCKHPNIETFGEVFNKDSQNGTHRFPDPRQVMEGFWTARNVGLAAHAYIGMRGGVHNLMAPQLDYNDFWEHLPKRLKVISLRRHDLFARHVSHLKAKVSNVWNRYGDDKAKVNQAVTVEPAKLVKDAAFVKKVWEAVDKRYPERLVVWYEDMCNDWPTQMKRMLDYLGVSQDGVDMSPSSNKIGRSLKEDVANYDQVMAVLERQNNMMQVRA